MHYKIIQDPYYTSILIQDTIKGIETPWYTNIQEAMSSSFSDEISSDAFYEKCIILLEYEDISDLPNTHPELLI